MAKNPSVLSIWHFCENCGASFLRPRSKTDARFCSRSCNCTALNADPDFKKQHSERMKALHQDPVFQKHHSERMKALHQDPVFQKHHSERMSKLITALNQDPDFKKRQSERMIALNLVQHQDPVFQKQKSERMSKLITSLNADPDFKKRQSERMAALGREYGPHTAKWQHVLTSALGIPPDQCEFYINLRSVRDQIPGCGYWVRVDIAYPSSMTVCEVDGWSHNCFGNPEKDRIRDAALNLLGWKVLRVRNEDIEADVDAVVAKVRAFIRNRYSDTFTTGLTSYAQNISSYSTSVASVSSVY